VKKHAKPTTHRQAKLPRYAIYYTVADFRGYYGLYSGGSPQDKRATNRYAGCRGGSGGNSRSKIHNQDVVSLEVTNMQHFLSLWRNDDGQDIAEYAVMLAVILVIVVGTIRLIGSNANNVFSSVASSIQ
jgi:Flp pilus assembly pilin Flp